MEEVRAFNSNSLFDKAMARHGFKIQDEITGTTSKDLIEQLQKKVIELAQRNNDLETEQEKL